MSFALVGTVIISFEQTDPTGIGMAYQRQWRVWNLWFTPVSMDIVKKTCSCISANIETNTVPFGSSRTVSLVVSAINKSQDFDEKAVLEIARGRSKMTKVLNVRGKRFAGFFAWPDAICIPKSAKNPYSELVKVKYDSAIPLEDINVQTIEQSNVQTEWLSEPNTVDDGTYAEATLKITINSEREYEDYLTFSVRGTVVKTVKIFFL